MVLLVDMDFSRTPVGSVDSVSAAGSMGPASSPVVSCMVAPDLDIRSVADFSSPARSDLASDLVSASDSVVLALVLEGSLPGDSGDLLSGGLLYSLIFITRHP